MGSAILNAERPRRSGPFREHGVHVGHEENSSVAGAGECGDDVVANRRLGWKFGPSNKTPTPHSKNWVRESAKPLR